METGPAADGWTLVCWGILCLAVSLWASGFSFGQPRWQPPRLMLWPLSKRQFEKRLSHRTDEKGIWEIHKERNTLSYRLLIWALELSDYAGLTEDERVDRGVALQGAIAALLMTVVGLAIELF